MRSISTYNGAKTEKYAWSQDLHNVTVQINLPQQTRSKDLKIEIKPKYVMACYKGKESEPLIKGEICEKVKVDDTMWSIEEGTQLIFNFEKAYEAIWKCVVLGDEEIDTKTVDNSKRVEDFDQETQGHLQKVLYERDRKMNGLPTTEEEKNMKLMNDIMKNPNSPFAGQPYDVEKYGNKSGSNAPIPPFNV